MAVPLEKFVKQLEDSGILDGDTLKDFLPPKSVPKDAEELALELVRKKKLTKFQAEEVSKGKGKSLILGNYVLLEKIGAGGMGQVFKARHQRMDRLVAVKFLPTAMTKDASAVARFEREVKAAAKLRHPNIIAADDADQSNGIHFLVMEYVDGSDLSALVKKNGPFSVDQTVNYILQAARGLEFAHKKGVVHRDIKPANLLLDSEGTIKILDMGLARIHGEAGQAELTSTGAVMGTVDYMAPEQALNTKSADARADIYSLGCTLYYLLTAKATYDGDTLMAKLLAHRDHEIPTLQSVRSDVPEQLQAVFRKMVAKKVEERFQSMTEVIVAIKGNEVSQGNSAIVESSDSQQMNVEREKPTISSNRTVNTPTSKEMSIKTKSSPPRKPPVSANDDYPQDFFDDLPLASMSLRTKKSTKKKTTNWKKSVLKDQKTLLMIGGGFLAFAILMAVVIVTVRSGDTKLVVTVNEEDAVVEVVDPQGEVEIRRKSETEPLKISVEPGQHRIRVQKQGFELFVTDSFEIKSGKTVTIKAELVPVDKPANPSVADAKPVMNANPSNRADAEWKSLFDGTTLNGWSGDVGTMTIENGILVNDGKRGNVIAPGDYRDAEVEIDFRLANGGNSGLGICYSGSGDPAFEGLEIQMLDDDSYPNESDSVKCGSIWSVAVTKPGHFKRWPEWNRIHVTTTSNEVRVELNGFPVTAATRADMQRIKPTHAGVWRTSGKLCLCPNTGRSEYRNFRVRSVSLTGSNSNTNDQPPTGKRPPNDAIVFNGHSYKFFPEVLSWHQAKSRCEEMGGHLPIIENDEENSFVNSLAAKSKSNPGEWDGVWAGATDEQKEGDWKWLDGKPMTFAKWADGQPNNKQNNEHYLLLWIPQRDRDWCDQPATSTQHSPEFICEWDSVPASKDSANPADPGWISLLNGRNLDGWKVYPGDNSRWEVKDGILIGNGSEIGHLFSERGDYENFHFRVEAKISDGGNSGQYFRTKFEPNFPHGYEAQINSTGADTIKTGSLYNLVTIREILVQPNEWFTQEVIAEGNHIVILLNGKKVVDFVDQANTYSKGHLAFQHNTGSGGKDTVVQFRKIEVRELPKGDSRTVGEFKSSDLQQWIKDVQTLSAEKQLVAVSKKLMELNPGYDGKMTNWWGRQGEPFIENGVVTNVGVSSENVTDLSPFRALVGLKRLGCDSTKVKDLTPLIGLHLEGLSCHFTQITDLSPLKGMPLKDMWMSVFHLVDLSPLKEMKLRTLHFGNPHFKDLSILAGMPLESLMIDGSAVSDLSPLKGMRLTNLNVRQTLVSDLSPLVGMPLTSLDICPSKVTDLSPLAGMKLVDFGFVPNNIQKGMEVIRGMDSLKHIHTGWTDQEAFSPEEFWKKYDAGEFGKAGSQ